MVVLIVLAAGTLLARGAGAAGMSWFDSWAAATRGGLALMLLFTGTAHFNSLRHDLVRMMPARVPHAMGMVYFTGVCEILGGIGLLLPATRRAAAIALIVFFVVVLPANIRAAREKLTLGGRPVTPLVPRIAMQVLFIGLTWWAGRR